MSAQRSLVPELEASLRHVKARRWNLVLDEAAGRVKVATDAVDRMRHSSAPSATTELLRALGEYFVLAEQAREEIGR